MPQWAAALVGQRPAQTVAERRDLGGAALAPALHRVHALEMRDGGGHVLDRLSEIEPAEKVERPGALLVGIAEVDPPFEPVEHVRREDDIALFGEVIAGRADRFVHAEDFLQDHQAGALAALRQGEITLECAAVRGGNVDELAGHVVPPDPPRPRRRRSGMPI